MINTELQVRLGNTTSVWKTMSTVTAVVEGRFWWKVSSVCHICICYSTAAITTTITTATTAITVLNSSSQRRGNDDLL